MTMEFTISGDEAVLAKLKDFRGSMQKRLIEGAARAALKLVVADVRARVPRNTGSLRKSIGTKKSKKVAKGDIVLSVGARPGFEYVDEDGKKHDPFFYALPLEYGHAVVNSVTKAVVGHVAPAGMFRSAYERNRDAIVERFGAELEQRIEAQLSK